MEIHKNIIQRIAIGDGFRRSAERQPDKLAIIERRGNKDLKITYEELNAHLNRFARAMRSLGLKQGDKIACLGQNSIEFAISVYGAPKGGFVLVPVNTALQVNDVLHILNHAEVKAFVFEDTFMPLVSRVMQNNPRTVKQFIFIPISGTAIPENEDLINFNNIMERQSSAEVEDVIIWERDIAEISYTSGTTAAPKGALISHLSTYIPALQTLIEMAQHFNEKTVVGMILPIFHCGGRTFTTSMLFVGGTTVLFRGFDPEGILSAIERNKITHLIGLPMMWRAIFSHPKFDNYDTSSLNSGVYGMAPMDEKTLKLLVEKHGIALYLNSGQTEFFPPTNYCKPEWQLKKIGNYWGTPGMMVNGAIMGENGNLCPSGVAGEIVWRGPACMEGYLKDAEATDESRKYGWHHSGDVGLIDEDGLLKFLDRKKDTIKSGGENVSSVKVEEVILGITNIESVGVVGLPHERWGEAVTAFVVSKKDKIITEEEILSICKEKLGLFEVPKKIVFVDKLPLTATGKLRKLDLREAYKDMYKK